MYIGLDLGTSGLRGILVEDAAPLAVAEATYSVSNPHDGWSEQDPGDWLAAAHSVFGALREDAPQAFAATTGIAISGHMHGAVLLDEGGVVLRPCILWNDTRAHAEAAQMDETDGVRALSGNIVFPGFTAPKLIWVANHEPHISGSVATVMLPKDYVNYWLTGEHVTEMSDAAGTSWLDVGARCWSEPLLKAGGMGPDQMPRLIEGTGTVGHVRDALADELGLPRGTPVIAGGADNAAAACGVGVMGEGDAFVSLGTSGVMLAGRDAYTPLPESAVHTFCHAVPGKWYQMGVVLAATDGLNWLSRVVGAEPAALTDELGVLAAPGPLHFYPYLAGERTPHNDSHIRGGFTGLGIATDRTDMTRAVLAGVCFALRDSFEALKFTGARIESALAIGGGTRSDHWTAMLATALDLPLERPAQGEFGAAMGAARIAMCGVTGADPASVMTKPVIAETIGPDPSLRDAYEEAYETYRAGYSHLKAMQ
ncbi:MAG: xylulokinase [Pseudomonadota bacterium]